jgi:hypothetical protein
MVMPRTIEAYDPDCHVAYRKITLDVEQVKAFPGPCSTNNACAGILVILGVVGAGSAVVSGSIAIVGNVAYWAEHQANCRLPKDQQPSIVPESTDGPKPAKSTVFIEPRVAEYRNLTSPTSFSHVGPRPKIGMN